MFNMVLTPPLMRRGNVDWLLVGTKVIAMFTYYEIP